MTDVHVKSEKAEVKRRLFSAAVQALESKGWKVERVRGGGKSSLRRITRNNENKLVSIRTTQDQFIAFPPNKNGRGWKTLTDVDAVVAVSVDEMDEPRFAQVHMLPGDEMRDRFDRTLAARKAAGHALPVGRGVWLSLYHQEAKEPANRVGAGAGLKYPPIARVPLFDADGERGQYRHPERGGLTIAEAKVRLASSLGVAPDSIKITIEA